MFGSFELKGNERADTEMRAPNVVNWIDDAYFIFSDDASLIPQLGRKIEIQQINNTRGFRVENWLWPDLGQKSS